MDAFCNGNHKDFGQNMKIKPERHAKTFFPVELIEQHWLQFFGVCLGAQ